VQPDDEMCLCFHVTQRKLLSFIRVQQPQRASQLSECFGAGTGCGWCRSFLLQLFADTAGASLAAEGLPARDEYAQRRAEFIRDGKGTPPPESAHGT
jgi:bacterioferritin-associated ferredoxin